MALCGGVVGFFAARFGLNAASEIPTAIVIALIVLLIPSFFLVVALHEGGHALAGRWVDFEFRMFVVGPFFWQREGSRWRFKWNRNVNVSGGMVISIPRDQHNLARRFAVYGAGGPLASLLGACFFYIAHVFAKTVLSGPSWFSILIVNELLMLAFLSLVIFFVTAVPMHVQGFSTDGGRIVRLLRGGDVARFEVLLLKLITTSIAGVRPSQWDTAAINEAHRLADKLDAPMGVYIHAFLFQQAWDTGDVTAAEQHLQQYILNVDTIPTGFQGAAFLDASIFYAYAKDNPEKALQYWSKYKPSAVIPKAQALAAEAGLKFLEHDYESTVARCLESLKEIPSMLDQGVATALRDRLKNLQHAAIRLQEETWAVAPR